MVNIGGLYAAARIGMSLKYLHKYFRPYSCTKQSKLIFSHCSPLIGQSGLRIYIYIYIYIYRVSQKNCWGCRIHQLHLCRGVIPSAPMTGEVPVMLELWETQRTPSLPLLSGPLWPGVVAPDRTLSMF